MKINGNIMCTLYITHFIHIHYMYVTFTSLDMCTVHVHFMCTLLKIICTSCVHYIYIICVCYWDYMYITCKLHVYIVEMVTLQALYLYVTCVRMCTYSTE